MNQTDLFIETEKEYSSDIIAPVMATEASITARKKTKREERREHSEANCIPVLAIYPNRIVGYNEMERNWTRSLDGIQGLDEFGFEKPKNDTNGEVSKAANKRILNAVNWLYFRAKKKVTFKNRTLHTFRVNFITLTLPSAQKHTDKFIKKEMLNDFLEWMRYNYSVKYYLWKAETQKNGNIHFHITTDVFIEWWHIRAKWNLLCKKHGYIDEYHEKFKNMSLSDYVGFRTTEDENAGKTANYERYEKAWYAGKKDNWLNPNSTDVKANKNIKNMAAYMAKYMTKKNECVITKEVKNVSELDKDPLFCDKDNRTEEINPKTGLTIVKLTRLIKGRIWFLSTKLGRIKAPVVLIDNKTDEHFKILKTLKSSRFKLYDYATVLYYNYRDAVRAGATAFIDELVQLVFNIETEVT